ncbi:MAG: class I SAM-dependent methyltransferase [Chitinophagaceae bacterium]
MQPSLLNLLRCPVTGSSLQLQVISQSAKLFNGRQETIVKEGVLFSEAEWFFPVINGIPRLIVEAFADYKEFLAAHLPDYPARRKLLEEKNAGLLKYIYKKNRRTKQSFTQEWRLFDYEKDKTWDIDRDQLVQRFLDETGETVVSLNGKLIFDAGCGNGLLNQLVADAGATILGMDFSLSIERAYERNTNPNALFIQGDVQFPPVAFGRFDIVHSSGVLICTNNTELSFSCIEPCVKKGGTLSVWLYHPRKNFIHNLFNFIRRFTSRLPVKLQYYLYLVTIFPVSYLVKRLKGNKQNKREMMIDILDWFSPEFRWEHTTDEAAVWYYKRQYHAVKITTTNLFGFNITGVKQ